MSFIQTSWINCLSSAMKNKIYITCLMILLLLGVTGCDKSRTREDVVTDNMFMTDKILIYSDGYYGRSLEHPMEVNDKDRVKKLIDLSSNDEDYEIVSESDLLEGLNGIWLDFNNGTVIGMYVDEDYGNIVKGVGETSDQHYQLPSGLRAYAIELLKEKD